MRRWYRRWYRRWLAKRMLREFFRKFSVDPWPVKSDDDLTVEAWIWHVYGEDWLAQRLLDARGTDSE